MLCSMRSKTRSRYYVQCSLDDKVEQWSDEASGTSSAAACRPRTAARLVTGPVDREEHRAAAQLRRRADALRPPVPGRRRRAHRAAHRRQGPEPGRRTWRCLSRALAEHYRGSSAGIDSYSQRALARIWKAERFSWWFTSLMHQFPENGSFGHKMQRAELDYLFSSPAAQKAMAEN
jgi:p-hydroxybenzoate 3-monooxygenase